jgi:putative hydrolase of the HAD superfamily
VPASQRPPIRAVTFDFWDTIVAAVAGSGDGMRRLQIDRFAGTIEAAGSPVPPERLDEAFDANWARFEERWVANAGQHTPTDSVDLIAAHVGLDLEPALRDELIDGFRLVGERVELETGTGIEQALRSLRAAGIRIGIVCDVGLTPSPTLRRRLDELGLLAMFDAWSFSDETGWFKPAAEAFVPALQGLGVEAAETAHVGDSRRTDVAGARSLGMVAVRFTGFHDRPPDTGPEADHVIDDHRTLPVLLGLA